MERIETTDSTKYTHPRQTNYPLIALSLSVATATLFACTDPIQLGSARSNASDAGSSTSFDASDAAPAHIDLDASDDDDDDGGRSPRDGGAADGALEVGDGSIEDDLDSGTTKPPPEEEDGWTELAVPGAEGVEWKAIHGDGTGRIWVVGQDSTIATFFEGAWTTYNAGVIDDFLTVYAESPTSVYVGGAALLLFHFDGRDWHNMALDVGTLFDTTDVDYESIWSDNGEILVSSRPRARNNVTSGIIRRVRDNNNNNNNNDDAWSWSILEVDGWRSPSILRDGYAIAFDELWYRFQGGPLWTHRKPAESVLNVFTDLWVTGTGSVYVIANPDGDKGLFVLEGYRWSRVSFAAGSRDRMVSVGGLRGGSRVFVGGYDGYLGEVVAGASKTIEEEDYHLPTIERLYIDDHWIWATSESTVLRHPLPPAS